MNDEFSGTFINEPTDDITNTRVIQSDDGLKKGNYCIGLLYINEYLFWFPIHNTYLNEQIQIRFLTAYSTQ